MRGNILVQAGNGLCNRLFAVLNGLYLLEELELQAIGLRWPLGPSCPCPWAELFEAPDVAVVEDGRHPNGRAARVVVRGPRALDVIPDARRVALVERFVPVAGIRAAVNAFAAERAIDRSVIGVHLRKTDRLASRVVEQQLDESVARQLDAILEERPGQRFLLCSDDADSERRFVRRYAGSLVARTEKAYVESPVPGRRIDRALLEDQPLLRSAESVKDGLVDLYLLGLCERVVTGSSSSSILGGGRHLAPGEHRSSFAEFARLLCQADLGRLGMGAGVAAPVARSRTA